MEIQSTGQGNQRRPYFSGWELGNGAIVSSGNFSLVVVGIQLTKDHTRLFFSLTGMEAAGLAKASLALIYEAKGIEYQLSSIIQFADMGEVVTGMIVFPPRPLHARSLSLEYKRLGQDALSSIEIARFHETGSEDRLDMNILIRRETPVEQDGYRVVMNLWLPPETKEILDTTAEPPKNSAPYATATPAFSSMPPWITIPEGIFVQNQISFIIGGGKFLLAQTVLVQLLSDGNVISSWDGNVTLQEPLPVITPQPGAQIYP